MSFKVAVIGMGAVGSLYASKLQAGGAEIYAYNRSDFDVVSKQGIQIIHPNGSSSLFMPDHVVSSLDEIHETMDLVLVSTKVLPEINIVASLKKVTFKAVLLLQNGIFIEDNIVDAFPEKEILSGLAFVCVSKTAPGHIHHQDFGALSIGNFPNGISTLTQDLEALFSKAKTKCFMTDNIKLARFKKLCWNAPFNPLSITEGLVTTEALLAIPNMEAKIRRIMKEVQVIAEAAGEHLDDRVIEKHISDTKNMVAYKTSMLLDWEAGRTIESDAILGNAYRFAKEKGLLVPEISALYEKLNTKIKERKQ